MGEDNNGNLNRKLYVTMQLINVFIGVIVALICAVAYTSIDSIYTRETIIGIAICFGIVCFINLYRKLHKKDMLEEAGKISKIELVNEENEIIKFWYIDEKISFLIGKKVGDSDVLIDLSNSIYSNFIEDVHAVFNYASGKWYIEDLSENSGVSIQKIDDNKRYRIVKNTPCELKKGDIVFISKVKLLLK
ncbi:FHA domain-containing protein [uncultured Clostridium sp.]|uniref:FHA domain-containing protein n=1 Tax=uncultured Clostridium sp. TaxID=59620 RepID=UPI0028E8D51E|nr:FHA domain-containing protein [uncultured Clostridium sp.]